MKLKKKNNGSLAIMPEGDESILCTCAATGCVKGVYQNVKVAIAVSGDLESSTIIDKQALDYLSDGLSDTIDLVVQCIISGSSTKEQINSRLDKLHALCHELEHQALEDIDEG